MKKKMYNVTCLMGKQSEKQGYLSTTPLKFSFDWLVAATENDISLPSGLLEE